MNHYETLRLLWIVGRTVAPAYFLPLFLKRPSIPFGRGLSPCITSFAYSIPFLGTFAIYG